MSGSNGDDEDVNTQTGAQMGFGGGYDLGSVGTGAAFDAATASGLGGGLGLTEANNPDLGGQVSMGSGDAWGPSFGSRSISGILAGTALGALVGSPLGGIIGAYGPGAVNSMFGRGGTPETPGIFGAGPGGMFGPGGAFGGIGNMFGGANSMGAAPTAGPGNIFGGGPTGPMYAQALMGLPAGGNPMMPSFSFADRR